MPTPDLRPPTAGSRMASIDQLQGPASDELNRLRTLAGRCGFTPEQLANTASAVHAVIALGEADFVVLSIEFGTESLLFLSCGVLGHITADKLTALEGCNACTRSRPAYPCFLAQADGPLGCDVIVQQAYPTQLLFEAPGFFKHSIESSAGVTRETRERLLAAGLGGRPFTWTKEEAQRVAARAV
jgi:hypothetical protein